MQLNCLLSPYTQPSYSIRLVQCTRRYLYQCVLMQVNVKYMYRFLAYQQTIQSVSDKSKHGILITNNISQLLSKYQSQLLTCLRTNTTAHFFHFCFNLHIYIIKIVQFLKWLYCKQVFIWLYNITGSGTDNTQLVVLVHIYSAVIKISD